MLEAMVQGRCVFSGIKYPGTPVRQAESSTWASCSAPRGGGRGGFLGSERPSQLVPMK